MTERVCIAAIAGAFGVRGAVRLKSFTAVPQDVAAYGALETEEATLSFTVTLTGETTKGALVARVAGVTSKEKADALRGERLYVDRTRLPGLPDDEFYHADLIGLDVFDTGGARLGRVTSVLNHGASDILEVAPDGGPGTVLIPFTLEAVPNVDLTARRIIADPPEGTL